MVCTTATALMPFGWVTFQTMATELHLLKEGLVKSQLGKCLKAPVYRSSHDTGASDVSIQPNDTHSAPETCFRSPQRWTGLCVSSVDTLTVALRPRPHLPMLNMCNEQIAFAILSSWSTLIFENKCMIKFADLPDQRSRRVYQMAR